MPGPARPTLLRGRAATAGQAGGTHDAQPGRALATAIPDDRELQLAVADLLWRGRDGAAALPLCPGCWLSPRYRRLAAPDPGLAPVWGH